MAKSIDRMGTFGSTHVYSTSIAKDIIKECGILPFKSDVVKWVNDDKAHLGFIIERDNEVLVDTSSK